VQNFIHYKDKGFGAMFFLAAMAGTIETPTFALQDHLMDKISFINFVEADIRQWVPGDKNGNFIEPSCAKFEDGRIMKLYFIIPTHNRQNDFAGKKSYEKRTQGQDKKRTRNCCESKKTHNSITK
jgi:hypothetical protein